MIVVCLFAAVLRRARGEGLGGSDAVYPGRQPVWPGASGHTRWLTPVFLAGGCLVVQLLLYCIVDATLRCSVV